MQLSSDMQIPDGLLAEMALLSEKPRLGFRATKCTAHQGLEAAKSLNRVRDTTTVVRYAWQMSLKAQQQTGEGSASNVQKRDALAAAAGDQYHSTKWNPKGGYSQCNVFVCAMIDKVGLDGPRNDNGHAITAGQWADPKFAIDNWRVLGKNEAVAPGDVAAVAMPGAFSNASGHMGIVSDLEGGVPHIMAAGSQHVYRTSAANFEPNYTIVYRRYVGQ